MFTLRPPASPFFSLVVALAAFSKLVLSLGPLEPNLTNSGTDSYESLLSFGYDTHSDGQVYLAAWINPAQPFYDTPAAFNKRIGFNAYAFQFAQTIPITPYSDVFGTGGSINETLLELSGTSAAVFLTVYPLSLGGVSDGDLTVLANQIATYQTAPYNRDVFLRFGPEMQGNWMTYGVQPTAFVALWKRMHDIIRSIAPKTVLVWAPNAAMGYPFGATAASVSPSSDVNVLDTNHNGQLDGGDDAYAPYYPGDDYVDWNAISWYWKGSVYPYTVNQVQPVGYAAGAMTGHSPAGAIGTGPAESFTGFYGTYCQTKPCMFAEMGAAFHANTTSGVGPGQLAIETAWWQDTLTSTSFMDAYPKMKMFMLFEQIKTEDANDLRDFRLTNDSAVRGNFLKDLSTVSSRYVWAQNRASSIAGSASSNRTSGSSTSLPSQTKKPSIFRNDASQSASAPQLLGMLGFLGTFFLLVIT
ncbi:hypothetical protein CROQUDRAFT_133191 [Cronartium quercuum f. sp. fusiforme G11]|uniref:GH26 domain-containing protein n=1 Tax=Cronartium quercuum f. sp. fusiforme G11 TaxID=708437 RepID=A0A9P6NLG6_9BASI|nr:hypothetical protein CROQUDRAFT_133191 [Cronartium quercuum f. sp. fusiforme G11]